MKLSICTFIKSSIIIGLIFGLAVPLHAQTEDPEKKTDELVTHSTENRGSATDEKVSSETPLNSIEVTMLDPKPGVDQISTRAVRDRSSKLDHEVISTDVTNRISAERSTETDKPDVMSTRAHTLRGEQLEEKLEEPTVINQRNSPIEFVIPPHKKRDR